MIDDLPGDTVEELLKYIYTDSSHNVESFSQTLLAASDKYKVKQYLFIVFGAGAQGLPGFGQRVHGLDGSAEPLEKDGMGRGEHAVEGLDQ